MPTRTVKTLAVALVAGLGLAAHASAQEVVYQEAPGYAHIYRAPVVYTQWYPAVPYGHPNFHIPPTAPMVYTPTDTTQLGYYYQQVPTWHAPTHALPRPWFAPAPTQYGYAQPGRVISVQTKPSNLKPVPKYDVDPPAEESIKQAPPAPAPVDPVPSDLPSDPAASRTGRPLR